MANLKTIAMDDGVVVPCNLDGRQYHATGTGAVEIHGIAIGSTTFEKLCTLTVSGSAVSQRSSDLYPHIKGVVTSGAPKFNVMGFER
jgi:hypothetical protein